MPRIRTIKPDFFIHERLAQRSVQARLLFIGLWTLADGEGRLEDRPLRIKAQLFPYEDFPVEACLAELAEGQHVARYEAGGLALIQVTGFRKHQRITGKEALEPSKFPAPDGFTSASPLFPDGFPEFPQCPGKGKGKGKGNGVSQNLLRGAIPAPAPEDAVYTLPCKGLGAKEHHVTAKDVQGWAEAFPAVDVLSELRKMTVWLAANPTKGKTATGMPRFIVSWLSRAQDDAHPSTTHPGATNGRARTPAPHHRTDADAAYLAQLGSGKAPPPR